MEQTDEQLVENHLKGDEKAFEQLVSKYLTQIFNFVYRLTGNREESNDITQDVFLKIWKNLDSFDTRLSFRAWMYGIARNTSIDWLRKKKPLSFSKFDNEEGGNVIDNTLADDQALPDEIFEQKEAGLGLDKAMSSLSLEHRSILMLKHMEELTFEEMAIILNKPMNTVKSQYRRALIQLRAILTNAPK